MKAAEMIGKTMLKKRRRSLLFEKGDEIQVMQEMVAGAKSGITNENQTERSGIDGLIGFPGLRLGSNQKSFGDIFTGAVSATFSNTVSAVLNAFKDYFKMLFSSNKDRGV
ncbi:hypothetical protein C5167_019230 [Papaver somniferum]|uniref:Uncharacterized protein n=1 Tax=Papaver somniferum TaxID=3469 RepID=A0A4Y7IPK2_PAPSO|nr:hypothetical protein C5167_019230 [Papaver somniferum]